MTRPKYKELWLSAEARLEGYKEAAADFKRELERIDHVLAEAAHTVVPSMPDGDGPIDLAPLPYECVAALLRVHGRGRRSLVGFDTYTWRGRPLRRKS